MNENEKYYPYHVDFSKLRNPENFNSNYPDFYHTHGFLNIFKIINREPEAFYLSDVDKTYYNENELEKIKDYLLHLETTK